MSVVSCPKCGDSVVLPGGASPEATVRCPLCQEEFPLAEVLDSLPPALIVVHDPNSAGQTAAAEPFSFETALDDASPYELAEPESGGVASIAIEPLSESTAPATAPAGKRRRTAPRPQRRKKKPAVEVAKIVLGGIAGLTIAQLILWWMPWTKYRRDPFKLGPKVAAYASWIVPAQFHGTAQPPPVDGDDAESRLPDSPAPSSPGPVANGPGSGIPQRTFVDPNNVEPEAAAPAGAESGKSKRKSTKQPKESSDASDDSIGPMPGEPGQGDFSVSLPDDISDAPEVSVGPLDDLTLDTELLDMIDDPTADPGTATPDDATEDPLRSDEPTTVRIAGAPRVTPVELRDVVAEANDAMQAWLATDDPNSRELVLQAYRALAKMGEAVTFSTGTGDEEESSLSGMLSPLAADGERLSSIRLLGSRWPTYSQRDTAGVVLTGRVAEVREEGELFVTDLTVADDTMAVYSDADPTEQYQEGASILVLGAIVEEPVDNVVGYQGDADWLIWYGMSRPLAGD